jgi:hypothetical protein
MTDIDKILARVGTVVQDYQRDADPEVGFSFSTTKSGVKFKGNKGCGHFTIEILGHLLDDYHGLEFWVNSTLCEIEHELLGLNEGFDLNE